MADKRNELDAILREYTRLNRAYAGRYNTVCVSRKEEIRTRTKRILNRINEVRHNESR